tara:strand:+ start:362 stop:781 length:420 start_codon:yes stop_codon:yes gene_type:complete
MKNENFNAYSALLFIDLIIESNNFYKQLIDKFPDVQKIADQLHKDPTDQNKDFMFSVYEQNENTFKEFTHSYIQDNSDEFDWDQLLRNYEVTPVGGKFFKFDKTPEAYEELINKMHNERWVFHHMSITSENDKYVAFFA